MTKKETNVSSAIKHLRKKLNMTQREFATYYKLAQSTVSGWESGYRPKMSPEMAKYFVEVFKENGICVALQDLI